MSSRRKSKSAKAVTTQKTNEHWWLLYLYPIKFFAWFIGFLIAVAGLYFTWLTLEKSVEVDLSVTNLRIESDTPTHRIYAIDFVINNSGNQAISIKNATPFIRHVFDHDKPLKILTASNRPETFTDNAVEGGQIKSFSAHAYVDKSFILAGIKDQKEFSKYLGSLPNGKKLAVSMEVELGVRIYGADRKERSAISPPLGVIYSEGRQIKFREQSTPVAFEQIDISHKPTFWDIEEPRQ